MQDFDALSAALNRNRQQKYGAFPDQGYTRSLGEQASPDVISAPDISVPTNTAVADAPRGFVGPDAGGVAGGAVKGGMAAGPWGAAIGAAVSMLSEQQKAGQALENDKVTRAAADNQRHRDSIGSAIKMFKRRLV